MKEYEIKIIERDPNKEYLILKINGEEVKIEKISKEELNELEKKFSRIDKWPLWGGTIRFKREELRIKNH
jgi:hypothetical protein